MSRSSVTLRLAASGVSNLPPTPLAWPSTLGLCLRLLLRLAAVLLDELLRQLVRLVVHDLLRRRLHEVRARPDERAGDVVVERELRHADGVDDDPRRVRRVPDLELELEVEGHVAEGGTLHPDVGPLAVAQPRHVVGRADMHVPRAEVVVE